MPPRRTRNTRSEGDTQRPDWTFEAAQPPRSAPGPTDPPPSWPWGSGDPERYQRLDEKPLGAGGMGSVWRVRDRWLNRDVVMKVIHPDLLTARGQEAFVREVHTAARLHHPAIVPLLDVGIAPGGRGWYTMPIVEGRTLATILADLHARSRVDPAGWRETADGHSLRGLLGAFATVCEAIAYAHSQDVLHLDLKPGNIMLGAYGQVTVMDWGLTRALGERLSSRAGTPSYMAPEALSGMEVQLVPALDVYGLGATLYELLSGRPPWSEHRHDAVPPARLREAPPEVDKATALPVPPELAALCRAALDPDPRRRPAGAAVMASELRAWLDGARRRDQAAEIVRSVADLPARIAGLRASAKDLRYRAVEVGAKIPRHASIADKRPIWLLEDEAAGLEAEADRLELDWLRAVQGALRLDPDQPEAHAALADHHRARHAAAERAGDHGEALREQQALDEHDRTDRYRAYLRGDGRLSLLTEPPGARVRVSRYVERDRRLVPEPVVELGPTPLVDAPLPWGSYLLELEAAGHDPLRLPVAIGRGETWSNAHPDGGPPLPVRLLPRGALGPDDVYVPAGAFWCGGDPRAPRALPGRRVWLEGFILRRYPVTCQEYCDFLNDLVASGRPDEARAAWPGRELLPQRDDAPGYQVGPDPDGDPVHPRRPVTRVNLAMAEAYAAWLAARTGLPWRLPGELALEKAARGVDGRLYPFGDQFDPTWCNMSESHAKPQPVPVEGFPTDESPWGARGLAGNVICWTADPYRPLGPEGADPLPLVDRSSFKADFRYTLRGSSFTSADFLCRCCTRYSFVWAHSSPAIGLRLARPLE